MLHLRGGAQLGATCLRRRAVTLQHIHHHSPSLVQSAPQLAFTRSLLCRTSHGEQALVSVSVGPHVSGASLNTRYLQFHTGRPSLGSESDPKNPAPKKASSKIEETVNRLKAKQEEKEKELNATKKEILAKAARVKAQMEEVSSSVIPKPKPKAETKELDLPSGIKPKEEPPTAAASLTTDKPEESKVVAKKPLWDRIKAEAKHYYSGFKLLYLDVKICSKILWKVLQGNRLTRRENKQLIRTVSDLFRLVPFSVFILVPFMEFLLPVALKLFPGMLPSTFTTSSERETKMRRTLKAKLEYAKFLQRTLDEMGPASNLKDRKSNSAADFVAFFKSVKEQGRLATNKDIIKFSKLFEDEITLDNMTRNQLVALCRLLELTPIGTNAFLKFQLEMKVRQLKDDDQVIKREGLDNMDVHELQVANKERGMRALGMPEERLRKQLSQWLDLSLNENIPPSLLLLSRTLFLPENVPATAQIAASISALPDAAAASATAQIGEREGKIRNVVRLEQIREEQKKIEEEELERKKEVERKKQQAEEKKKKVAAETTAPSEPPKLVLADDAGAARVTRATVSDTGDLLEQKGDAELLVDKAPELISEVPEKAPSRAKEAISSEDLSELKSAIESLGKASGSSSAASEKEDAEEEIDNLKRELQDYEQDVEELAYIKASASRPDIYETPGARRLFSKVNSMLGKVDFLLDSLQDKERALEAHLAEMSASEAEKSTDARRLVTVQELIDAVQRLQGSSDSDKVEQIAEVLSRLDDDADGVVNVDHVLSVIELLGTEHVKLSPDQIGKVIDMLKKEEQREVQSNIERILVEESGPADAEEEQSSSKEEEMKDTAKDLTEQEPELHIKEMFQQSGRPLPPPEDSTEPGKGDFDPSEPRKDTAAPSKSKKRAVMQAKPADNKNGPSDLS